VYDIPHADCVGVDLDQYLRLWLSEGWAGNEHSERN
jgi:hypothetical protein